MALIDLFKADRDRLSASTRSSSTFRVYDLLQSRTVVSIRRVAESLAVSVPTATAAVKRLEDVGIASESTGKSYGRVFVYTLAKTLGEWGIRHRVGKIP